MKTRLEANTGYPGIVKALGAALLAGFTAAQEIRGNSDGDGVDGIPADLPMWVPG